MRHSEIKQREIKESIGKLTASLSSMRSKLQGFETNHQIAQQKAESQTEDAANICTRVPVTKSVKNFIL